MSRASGRPEKVAERAFTKKVRELGGEVLKQGGQGPFGIGGYQDRLALCPHEAMIFLEFKRITNGKIELPSKRQASRHRKLKKLGYRTFVVATVSDAFKHCRIAMKLKGAPKKLRDKWRV